MKKLFNLLFMGLVLGLSSCGGGWTNEQITTLKNDCVMEGEYDCDCYVNKAKEMFKNPDQYNDDDSELYEKFEKAVEDCKLKDTQADDEAIESF